MKYLALLLLSINALLAQPIYEYAKKGDVAALEALKIEDNTLLDKENKDGYTPLMMAAYYNKTEMISYLLAKKVAINAVSAYGTALMAATVRGHKEAALLLLKEGADPNISDENKSTALQFAALFGRTEIAESLLKNGANLQATDARGMKALDYAIMKKNETLITLIKTYQ